ncbi:MAG: DUF3987 domain-containing protein, partial [Planctomycetaceae bacterium]|nr:DUF3987 domain-containing protein [Planctomycetaceae bacterium]
MKEPLRKDRIKELARGREIEILVNVAGIGERLLNNKKEHPCPKCGGSTRFRLIKPDAGAVRCNQCFSEKCGDFIAAVQWMKEVTFLEALRLIDEYLSKTPEPEILPKTTEKLTPKNDLWEPDKTSDEKAISNWCRKHKKGTSPSSVLRCGGTTGKYKGNPVLGLPMLGADLKTKTGMAVYPLDGSKINGKKVINTLGSISGIIGTVRALWKLLDDRGQDTDAPIKNVFKVEGPSDVLAFAKAIPESERQNVAVFTNGCGASENPDKEPYKELLDAIAAYGCKFIVIGDNDEPGQRGVARWSECALQKGCDTRTITLPTTINDSPINDLRDYFLAGGKFADLLKLAKPFKKELATKESAPQPLEQSFKDWIPDPIPNEEFIAEWCPNHEWGTDLDSILRFHGTSGWYNGKQTIGFPMFGSDFETILGWTICNPDRAMIGSKKIICIPDPISGIIGTVDELRRLPEVRKVHFMKELMDAIVFAKFTPELDRKNIAIFTKSCGATETPDGSPDKEMIENISNAGSDLIIAGDNSIAGEKWIEEWGKYAVQKGCSTWKIDLPPAIYKDRIGDIKDYLYWTRDFTRLTNLARPFVTTVFDSNFNNELLEWIPYPVDTFPESLRKYIVESAAARSVDPAYVGPFVLAVIASVIGSGWRIKLKETWKQPAIIWLATVATSGSGKTPGLDAAIEPLRTLQKEADKRYGDAQKEFEKELVRYDQSFALWKAEQKKNPSQEPPEKPTEPIFDTLIADDTTPEALLEILEQNPFGVCQVKDELSGWFGGLDAYNRGKVEKDLAFWLQLHDGHPCRANRKTGKKLVNATTPAVSICGGIQPGILSKILTENKHFFDAGLAARILYTMPPDVSQRWTDVDVDEATRFQYQNTIKKIISLRSGNKPLTPEDPCIVTLSKEAKELFVKFQNANADERDKMTSDTQKALWPKLTGYAVRIALVFHVVEWVNGNTDQLAVNAATMEKAIRLAQWHKRESLRIVELTLKEAAQVDLDVTAILETIKRKGGEITVRELQQSKRSYRSKGGAERATTKLNEMVTKGLLT